MENTPVQHKLKPSDPGVFLQSSLVQNRECTNAAPVKMEVP